jgi:hypothetical protein
MANLKDFAGSERLLRPVRRELSVEMADASLCLKADAWKGSRLYIVSPVEAISEI